MSSLIVACPHCSKLNRVPEAKLNANGTCGSCKAALFASKPININQTNFNNQVMKSEIPILVDFWASWCGPCKMMAPVLTDAATEFEPQLRIGKLNTEEEQMLGGQFNIRSIPTLVLFHHGKEIERVSGAMNLQQLKQWTMTAMANIKR